MLPSNITQFNAYEAVPKYMAMAMDKAYNTSDRAGIGCVLTHEEEVTELYSGFCGYVNLGHFIRQYQFYQESELFLSCPPHPHFISISNLNQIINELNVRQLHYPKLNDDLTNALAANKVEKLINCEIKVHNIKQISNRIFSGPISLLKRSRPWTRCFIGATMAGVNIPLDYFFTEFGVKSYLLEKLSQSTSIGFEPNFKVSALQLKENSARIEMLHYRINNVEDVKNAHSQLNLLNSPVLTILCSFELFSQLVNMDLVDECICHLSILNTPSPYDNQSHPLPNIELKGWKISESTALTKGVRIHLHRTGPEQEYKNNH